MMNVERPIFIMGLGRSGSTVFFDILSNHQDLVWLSQRICNRYPDKPELNRRLMDAINVPVVGRLLRRYFEPGECYPYWDTLFRGFSSAYRDLNSQDVTHNVAERIKNSLNIMVKNPKDRLVIKITGWNRMRFLREIYPDALFIHVERDPRAVINSFLNVYFWPGWKGPQHLLMGELSSGQKAELERFNHSFVALAGMQLVAHMDAFHEAKATIPIEQLQEVSYEQLCESPQEIYRNTCAFCDIEWNEEFERFVQNCQLRNTNNKWVQNLSVDQKKIAQYYYDKISSRYVD